MSSIRGICFELRQDTEFTVKEGILIKYKCKRANSTTIVIPSCVNESYIVEIGVGAFENVLGMEKVVIPNTVKSIGKRAFSNCSDLKEVEYSSDGLCIKKEAFSDCGSLEGVYCKQEEDVRGNLENVGYIRDIEDYAFKNCCNLAKVDFDKRLRVVGRDVFHNCICLKGITE